MSSEEAREELKLGAMSVHKVIGLLELLRSSGVKASGQAEQGIDGLIISAQCDLERVAEAIETEFPDDDGPASDETTIHE